MSAEEEGGRVVTFYSFKGGVGRTMALANVAFLAAMNRLNVLIMDWDLEAPGVHHYFRGIIDTEEMSQVRAAAGVLDIAWQWRNAIEDAEDATAIDALFELFRRGDPFEARVLPLMPHDEFGERGCIDIIPAGGRTILTPEPVEYERALAAFSWNDFLDQYVGGGMIEALRGWSRAKYDLVLIDSRTGLADVAGICTMQLPDAIVLAFVFNRQNIEGVARVAAAIRQQRGDALRIWPVPMRVSREGTAEEADASARAVRAFVSIGGLDREAVVRDMRGLLIKAEANVPFMESLAPFNDTDAALDPLTANMARLTKEITGIDITVPQIPEAWRDKVWSRQVPELSTEPYLRQLMTAEPLRAARELHRYVESALATLSEGDMLSDDYVTALAESIFQLQQREDDISRVEGYDTSSRLLILLRRLHEQDHDRWRSLLIEALESNLENDRDYYDDEDEIIALEEVDELLAEEPESVDTLARRADAKLKVARLYGNPDDAERKLASAQEALAHLKRARALPDGDTIELALVRSEAILQQAEAFQQLGLPDAAREALGRILKLLPPVEPGQRAEIAWLGFEANVRLMRLAREGHDHQQADRHAREAIAWASPGSPGLLNRVGEIADAILAGAAPTEGAAALLQGMFGVSSVGHIAHFYSRGPRGAATIVNVLTKLVRVLRTAPADEAARLVDMAVELVREILVATERRTLASASGGIGGSRVLRSQASLMPQLNEAVTSFALQVEQMLISPHLGPRIEEIREMARDLEARIGSELRQAPRPRPRPA